ncbi:hypothetical protein M885DRAFT_515239 [Pelagophyceae sp. CCMP2097]|nr:hypothetical protein M885DRAFT_515239 [Pelagophyceae sp. CCMP2097]
MISDTLLYLRALAYYANGGSFKECKLFSGLEDGKRMNVHVFSLVLALKLWHEPHYRKPSYAEDVRDNFQNVAVPGTGIALSILAINRYATALFLVTLYPLLCLVAGVAHAYRADPDTATLYNRASAAYRQQLLAPKDWFSLWRINSRLTAWHSLVTREADGGWHDYAMENKWAFIEKGLRLGVAVSPVLPVKKLCIKNINEEGGLGIYFYKNALEGGDWIIQEVMANGADVAQMLPANAPLSTFRVMTSSRRGMPAGDRSNDKIEALSCVFRAGRAGASTDHSSILFDVDMKSGKVGRGTTNMQWYQLGLLNMWPFGKVRWAPPADTHDHPDTAKRVTDTVLPDFYNRAVGVALEAHEKLNPRVPIAGWDVVMSQDHGVCLLEVNLSCNFFRGTFDEPNYVDFIHEYFCYCEKAAKEMKPKTA